MRCRIIFSVVIGTGRMSYRFLTGEGESSVVHPRFRIEKIRELETVFLLAVLLEVSHHLLELFFRDFSSRVPLLQYLRWPSPVVPIPAVAPAPPPPPEEEAEDEEDDEEEENEAEREEEEGEGEEPVVRVADRGGSRSRPCRSER